MIKVKKQCDLKTRGGEVTKFLFKFILPLIFISIFITSNAYSQNCEKKPGGFSKYELKTPLGYKHDKWGTLPKEKFFELAAYVSSFDGIDDDNGDGIQDLLAVPTWVSYEMRRLKKDSSGNFKKPKTFKRPSPWYEHPGHSFLRTDGISKKMKFDKSYSGIGHIFNRGHLAMRLHGSRISPEAGCNTHFFLNAVPQRAGQNQGIWRNLEEITGGWANKFRKVWVITGPIFKSKNFKFIGDPKEIPVAIPDEFFKIVVKENNSTGIPDILAFIYPQKKSNGKEFSNSCGSYKPQDHLKYLTSVNNIQRKTGLKFFNNLNLAPAKKRKLLKKKAMKLWPLKRKFVLPSNCFPGTAKVIISSQAEEPEAENKTEEIKPTDGELLRALINVLEEKGTIQKGDIFNKVKEMRE